MKKIYLLLGILIISWNCSAQIWSNTGSMTTERGEQTATLLKNGTVLLAGGISVGNSSNTCELYDPATGSWSNTGSMSTARSAHTATLLDDGRVLVSGGADGGNSIDTCELYDPATGSWSNAGSLSTARSQHTATRLADGRVVIIGGKGALSITSTCELYDPATGTWSYTGSMRSGRYSHVDCQLTDGRVLVSGGNSVGGITGTCELYDPVTGTWSDTGSMRSGRYSHVDCQLTDGRVLVSGGNSVGGIADTCELYNPVTGTWSDTGSMRSGRMNHTATVLRNGTVFLAGGTNTLNTANSCELYDPVTGTWSDTGSMTTARHSHSAVLLQDGKVLVAGGYDGINYTNTCELYISPPPACATGVTATPDANCGNYDNVISWSEVIGADGYNLKIGINPGHAEICDRIISGLSYSFTGNPDTTYYYTVTPFNSLGAATTCAEQSFSTNASKCYCISEPTGLDGDGITEVQLGRVKFFNNVKTFGYYAETQVYLAQGVNCQSHVKKSKRNISSNRYITSVYIDFNDDYVFESSEIVFSNGSTGGSAADDIDTSFLMPADANLGDHRLRICVSEAGNPVNPCYSGDNAVTLDFNIKVVETDPLTVQTVCTGTKVSDLIPSGPSGKWYLAVPGGKPLATTTLLPPATYHLIEKIDIAIEKVERAVIVKAKSVAGSISGAGTICSGSTKTLTLSASHVGTVQWQSSTESGTTGFSSIDGATENTYSTPGLITTTYYRAVVTSGVCSSKTTLPVTMVVSPPAVPGTIRGGDITVCAYSAGARDLSGTIVPFPNNTPLTLDGSSGTILWQKSTNYTAATPTWVSAGSTSNTLTATNIAVDTWYRAKVTSGACKPTSEVVKISVTKIARTGAVSATTNGVLTTSVCTDGDITFNSGPYIGDAMQWEYTEDAPPSLTNPTPQTWTVITEGKKGLNAVDVRKARFYYRAKYTSGTCTMAYSAAKAIKVDALTVAGRISVGGGPVCQGGSGKVIITGQIGKVQWEYSTDGSNYFKVPIYKAATLEVVNPIYEFSTTSPSGTGTSYTLTNIQSSVYIRAMVKNGQCNIEYTDPIQYVLGATAAAGTISSTVSGSLCNGTGTTLVLENYTGNTIQWYKCSGLKKSTEVIEWREAGSANKNTLATGNLTTDYTYKAVVSIANGASVCSGLGGTVYAMTSIAVLPKALAKTIRPVGFDNTIAADITNVTRVIKMDAGYIADEFQWQKGPVGDTAPASTSPLWTDIDGATTDTYVLNNPVEGTNWFRAKIVIDRETGRCSPVYSSAIRIKWSRTNAVDSFRNAGSQVETEALFTVDAYPNPYADNFKLSLSTSSAARIGLTVYDMIGRQIEQRECAPGEISGLRLGNGWPSGIYNVIFTQATEVKTLRVIKQ